MLYTVRGIPPENGILELQDERWHSAETAHVSRFRPESSDHRPATTVRLLHDGNAIHGLFTVRDRYVRCTHTTPQDRVCLDSCVEVFLRPTAQGPYMNFEFNAGGNLLTSCIRDWTRTDNGFADYTVPPATSCAAIRIASTLPARIEPERTEPIDWRLAFRIPFAFIEAHTGLAPLPVPGTWTGNFYKCGDNTSHPHWAAWSPVDELSFHLPRCFGNIVFSA